MQRMVLRNQPLNAYTIVLAYELKDLPFKVNAIDPGYTATDFNHHSGRVLWKVQLRLSSNIL